MIDWYNSNRDQRNKKPTLFQKVALEIYAVGHYFLTFEINFYAN